MKVTVAKNKLTQLSLLAGITNNKSPLPILSNVLIKAEDSNISFTATDLEIGARLSINADVSIGEESVSANIEEPGSICIHGNKLAEIIKLFADDSVVIISGTDRTSKVSDFGGKTSYTLPALDATDYPLFASFDELSWSTFSTGEIIKQYFRILYAASADLSRFNLNGIFYTQHNGKPSIVATDGHRLAIQTLEVSPFSIERVLLPRTAAEFIKKTLIGSRQSECMLAADAKNVYLSVGNMSISCRTIDGDYPDFTRVIADTSSAAKFSVNREDLIAAVRRAALVTMDRSRGLNVSVSQQLITLSASTEIGASHEELPIEYSGEPFELIANSNYILDALTALDGKQISIYYIGEGKPITMENDGKTDYFSLVMPMRK